MATTYSTIELELGFTDEKNVKVELGPYHATDTAITYCKTRVMNLNSEIKAGQYNWISIFKNSTGASASTDQFIVAATIVTRQTTDYDLTGMGMVK